MRLFMIIIYLLLIILGVSFAVLNANETQVNLYFTTLTLPISLLLTLVLGVGLVSGFILGLFKYWRLKLAFNKNKNQLKIMEKEIKNLRDIPLKNQH